MAIRHRGHQTTQPMIIGSPAEFAVIVADHSV
jgi:hypothetical protein